MSFLIRTLIKAIYAALLGLAMLGWLGAAAGATEDSGTAVPVDGSQRSNNPIPLF